MLSNRRKTRTKDNGILPLRIEISGRKRRKETYDRIEGINEIAVGGKVLSVLSVTKKGTENRSARN